MSGRGAAQAERAPARARRAEGREDRLARAAGRRRARRLHVGRARRAPRGRAPRHRGDHRRERRRHERGRARRGLARGRRRRRPRAARDFWRRVSLDGALSPVQRGLFDRSSAAGAEHALDRHAGAHASAPTRPIRSTSTRCATRSPSSSISSRCAPATEVQVFIAATNVWTGKVDVFDGDELTRRPPDGLGLPADAVPGGRDRRRALLGRRLHGQSGPVPAVLQGGDATTSCSSRSTRSSAGRRRARRARSRTASTRSPSTATCCANCAPSSS